MSKTVFRSRLGAAVVNARVALGEPPQRETVRILPIPLLVDELRRKNLWEAFKVRFEVVEADGHFWDPLGMIV